MTIPTIEEGVQPTNGRLLLVDDTPANLRMLMQIVTKYGYTAHPATDGETALRFIQSVLPDLVLVDVVMPGMDGYQFCERLKADKRTCDIPVIFLSSADQELDKMKAFASGGVDYIVRPLQAEEVIARIRTHLSLRALQKHLEELVQARTVELVQRTEELIKANAKLEKENAERTLAEERIRYMAHYDMLTGLPNRALLQDRTRQAIAHARRTGNQMAVLFIDLDYFKHINDSLGHRVGDCLLRMVGERLRGCLREGDSVARLGGDEFVLSLSTLACVSDAVRVAEKILDVLDQGFFVNGHQLHMGASIGISLYPSDGQDAESLMRTADTAMYYAKEKGRRNYQFFTPALNKAAQQRLEIGNRLRQALERGEFKLYYQPQVDMDSGRIYSAEALLRCPQPGGNGVTSCGPFIDVAEETGLILPIGEWVLQEACQQLRQWHDDGYPEMRMAVNLSSRQFYQPNFVNNVVRTLDRHGLPPTALDLEITESLLLQRNDNNVSILQQLSDIGIQLSVDDFGTGYSSLAYLQRFPVHSLKIDQSFVRGIGPNSGNTALVTAVIAMARSLHLNVLAEGVETDHQVRFLQANGCHCAQGFYYSKAIAADAFTALLNKQRQFALAYPAVHPLPH
jgi:diguanylate cyclase (GGDEF)-like protein